MGRRIRVILLLLVLATVALSAWKAKANATAWKGTLLVTVYPIAADDSPVTRRYLQQLTPDSVQPIADFLNAEARRYDLSTLRPVDVSLGPEISAPPPPRPLAGNGLDALLWSLKLRYWAWSRTPESRPKPHVRLYLLYHDPAIAPRVPHSSGLEKGLLGVVHLFASPQQAGQNNVVTAHELLHTLGASDKYDPATTLPRHPDGYANPAQTPLLPQDAAELMAGRIPISPTQAEIPDSLQQALIGPASAREIGWLK